MNKGIHRNKSKGGGNLNCKFKTFGFLDNLKLRIKSNYLASRNRNKFFYALHSSVLDLKSVTAQISWGGG